MLACLGVWLASCGEATLGPRGMPGAAGSTGMAGGAGTTGTGGAAGTGGTAGTGGIPTSVPIWSETSTGIEVSCFNFFQGSMRFAATRDQLSTAQLGMLSDMRAIDPVPTCVADLTECSLSIGQPDGTTTMIDAIQMNTNCDRPGKIVAYETFVPFLGSLGCQFAKNLSLWPDAGVPVRADVRCFNGLFVGYNGGTIQIALQVDDTSRAHRIELDECTQPGRIGKFSFSVLDSDGTTVLGTSSAPADPGANATCASAELTFPHTGLFTMTIQVASEVLPAGDLYLRFY